MIKLTKQLGALAAKRLLSKMIQLFGQNFSGKKELEEIKEEQRIIKQHLTLLRNAIVETNEHTGGKGWAEAMQNAVHGLDNRIDILWNTAQNHQAALEELKASRDQFWSQSLNLPATKDN
jgi:hypothetical protein